MALDQQTIFGLLQAGFTAGGIVGVVSVPLATAISSGFVQYITSSVIVTTIDVGVVGSGSGVGTGILTTPATVNGNLSASFVGQGVFGIMSSSLINAISQAISQALLSAVINSTHVGVGVGTGIAVIIPNSPASISIMESSFISNAIAGVMSPNLASAIAVGIDMSLLTATSSIVISGAGGPTPSTGVGTGFIS